MAPYQPRNQMDSKVKDRAQMLLLMNHVRNLESQIAQTKEPLNVVGMGNATTDPMQSLLNQMTSFQSQINNLKSAQTRPTGEQRSRNRYTKEVPVQPLPNLGTGMSLNGMLAAQLLGMNDVKRPNCAWVTGIPQECADADFLCNIFGNYGNVRRIKFSKKKADGALIQFQDPRQVTKSCRFLNNIRLGGEQISVKPSKIEKVVIYGDDEKSKDYSKVIEDHWRYNKDGKFTKIIMKRLSHPTPILLVSNVPQGKISELKNYIIESGYTVKAIEEGEPRKKEEKKSTSGTFAVVELASAEEAVSAVGKLHNTMPSSIGEKTTYGKRVRGLVFSFTTKKDSKEKA